MQPAGKRRCRIWNRWQQKKLILSCFECKSNCSAYVHSTAHMNRLAMCFNNVFTNCETKTCTANIAAAAKISAIKAFEYAVQMFLCNANTIIADFNKHMFFIGLVHTCNNIAALLAIFNRVLYKVYQYSYYFLFIGKNIYRLLASFFNAAFYISFCSLYGKRFKNIFDEILYDKILLAQRLFATFQFGYFIKIIYKIYHSFYIPVSILKKFPVDGRIFKGTMQ